MQFNQQNQEDYFMAAMLFLQSSILCTSLLWATGGDTVSRHYHAEAETKEGSDLKFKRSITKGDTISLNDLLFTNNRDYLIRNDNQHVKAEQLEGKVIGVYFVPLSSKDPRHSAWYTALLKDVYDDLHPVNNFETVLIACNDNDPDTDFRAEVPVHQDSQKVFHDLFSSMPWTAIPFLDVASRKHVQRSFRVPEHFVFQPMLYIVDQSGMVLQYDSWDILEYYGSLGYPFSDKRLKFLRTQDYLATQKPSLKALLGSPQRDYVISNNGEQVPIHTFEDKVVALYFYHPDRPNSLIEELKLAYEELAKIKKIFEVVLVYIYEPRQRHHWVNEMLRKYGIGGFPFTRKKSAELENEKIKELKLGMLWDPNTVFRRNDGSQVFLSQLSGKRVMLVLETFDVSRVVGDGSTEVKSITEFLTMLKERYLQKKGSDDEFEVIRILVSNTESSVNKHLVGDLPWLVSPGSKLMHELHSSFFWYGQSTCDLLKDHIPIFAFNPDGKLVRKTMYPTFEVSEFPFYAGSLEEETLSQLNTYWGYDYLEHEYFRYNGRIYK
ncbi:hypothetical protein OROHE_010307 [Orobanche hederae]